MQLSGWFPALPLILTGVAIPLFGGWMSRRYQDAVRIGRWRAFLDKHTDYEVVQCLGMGREGIVFEVIRNVAGETAEPPRALKLLDAKEARSLKHRLRLKEALEEAISVRGLEAWPCMPVVYELDVIRAGSVSVPYEEMELIRGETLAAAVERGVLALWRLEDRLSAFDELLRGLHELSEEHVNFVHIDPDNVMITEDQRFRLIDISGFRMVGLTVRRRRRMFRRLARTLLVLLQDYRRNIERGGLGENARQLLRQLEIYRNLPKGRRPPPEIEWFSIQDLRNRIQESFGDTRSPSG